VDPVILKVSAGLAGRTKASRRAIVTELLADHNLLQPSQQGFGVGEFQLNVNSRLTTTALHLAEVSGDNAAVLLLPFHLDSILHGDPSRFSAQHDDRDLVKTRAPTFFMVSLIFLEMPPLYSLSCDLKSCWI
jgi:hypothetical protein